VNLIFVYGTLKRGFINHYLMAGQEFAGTAKTSPGYALYDLEGYPGLVADAGAPEGVDGEVWCVDDECLAGLDVLEGTAEGLYSRHTVPVLTPFAESRIEAYIYQRSVEGRKRLGSAWAG
jgi:gamma-glutamylcyclotransferase (GGCT)/AIG2-like uncharacterized protein YtfP